MFNKISFMFQKITIYLFKKFRFFDGPFKRIVYRFFFKNKTINYTSEIKIDENKGFLFIDKDKFFKNEDDLRLCIDIAKDLYHKSNKKFETKNYLINLLELKKTYEVKKFLNLFLDKKIIEIVRSYLKSEPLLVELKLLHSPVIKNINSKGSQLFHCDFDDDKIVKIFINILNVNLNSGPLQAINKEKSNLLKNKLKYNFGRHSNDILREVDENEINTFVGSPGDILFIDTSSCFHRGSNKGTEDRLILYANFNSRSSYRFPPVFKNSTFKDIIKSHSPLFELSKLVDNEKKNYLLNL